MTPLGEMLRPLRSSERVMSDDERSAVTTQLFYPPGERVPYLIRFTVLIVLSTLIAAFGLVANSVAVIIGAMLIAPLMTPILAASASLVLSDLRRLGVNIMILAGGSALAILTAALAMAVGLESLTAATQLPSEIIARTQPSLIDLAVAVAAGLAAGYVITHPTASASLPGVAIAVALVPPLATVGIAWELGATTEAAGALLLFLTNLIAIVLSAILVMLLSGFVPPELRQQGRVSARIGLAVSLALLIVIAIPLTTVTVELIRNENLKRDVLEEIPEWDPNAIVLRIDADTSDSGAADVSLLVATTSAAPPPAWKLSDRIAEKTGRVVDLTVRFTLEFEDESTSG